MMTLSQNTAQNVILQSYEELRNELRLVAKLSSSRPWMRSFRQDLQRIRSAYLEGAISARQTSQAFRGLFDRLLQKKQGLSRGQRDTYVSELGGMYRGKNDVHRLSTEKKMFE